MKNIKIGTTYTNKKALYKAKLHNLQRAGVARNKDTHGKVSIILSGKYSDEDYGNRIIYMGPGGRDKDSKKHTKDQRYSGGNKWLHNAFDNNEDILVFRNASFKNKFAPDKDIEYSGRFYIKNAWAAKEGKYIVYKYELVNKKPKIKKNSTSKNQERSQRSRTSTQDTRYQQVVEDVKKWNDNTCQVCGERLLVQTKRGVYSEGAHIKGFQKYKGPDITSNMLCLCPNHHKMMDYYGFTLKDDLTIVSDQNKRIDGNKLIVTDEHIIAAEFIKFHRDMYNNFIQRQS